MEIDNFPMPAMEMNSGTEGFMNPEKTLSEFGIQPGMTIADFGCGTGHVGILIAQRVGENGKVFAIDIMEDKLDSIRTHAKAVGLKNLETIRANLEVLGGTKLADQSQDMTVLVNILFQSQKKSDILKESYRVLKQGGFLVVIDWKIGVGGFGPPDNLRTDENTMRLLITGEGLVFEKGIDAGQFHFGMKFKKP